MKRHQGATAGQSKKSGRDPTIRHPAKTLKPARRATRKLRRAMAGGLLGICLLSAMAVAGGGAGKGLHLALPGPVIGLAVLAIILILVKRFHTPTHRRLTLHVAPTGRALVSHMGLLFVPAGAGIIAEGDSFRQEWLPLIAGVAGSTVIGLLATGWLMHRFAPKVKN